MWFSLAVCKTTAKKIALATPHYTYLTQHSEYQSTYGVYETNYNSLQKIHMPAEICLSTPVLFFKEQTQTFLVNITGTSEALTPNHRITC